MALHAQGYVSIVELIVYIPALILAIMLCSRHGFTRASGWVYTIILCVVRIVGAICQLMTYTDHSDGLLKATLIIDSIGISPLLLATLGMLSRLVDWINSRGAQILGVKHFRLVQLLISLGLILSIVGGTSASSSDGGPPKVASTSKAGIILYVVALVAMVFFLFHSSSYRHLVPKQERRIPVAVALAIPFITVRLAYSVLAVFLHDHLFSVVGGSVAVRVGMATVEEFIVVIDYLVLGFSLKKLEIGEQGELATRQWKERRNRRQGTRGSGLQGDGQHHGRHHG